MRHPTQHLDVQTIQTLYRCSRSTAYEAKRRGWIDPDLTGEGAAGRGRAIAPHKAVGFRLSAALVEQVANHTARYLSRDYDTQQDIRQVVRILLWDKGIEAIPLAYKAAKRAGLNALRQRMIDRLTDHILDELLSAEDRDGPETGGQTDLGE
jgi:hypothetical protein